MVSYNILDIRLPFTIFDKIKKLFDHRSSVLRGYCQFIHWRWSVRRCNALSFNGTNQLNQLIALSKTYAQSTNEWNCNSKERWVTRTHNKIVAPTRIANFFLECSFRFFYMDDLYSQRLRATFNIWSWVFVNIKVTADARTVSNTNVISFMLVCPVVWIVFVFAMPMHMRTIEIRRRRFDNEPLRHLFHFFSLFYHIYFGVTFTSAISLVWPSIWADFVCTLPFWFAYFWCFFLLVQIFVRALLFRLFETWLLLLRIKFEISVLIPLLLLLLLKCMYVSSSFELYFEPLWIHFGRNHGIDLIQVQKHAYGRQERAINWQQERTFSLSNFIRIA